MALSITQPQNPEMIGISRDQYDQIIKAGGKLELPDASVYIRLGAIAFPKPRTILLQWERWKTAEDARARVKTPDVAQMLILPEPNVIRKELQDSEGNVVSPALVLPTYDEFMAAQFEEKPATLADAFDQVRKLAYQWAKTWPEFSGAIDV